MMREKLLVSIQDPLFKLTLMYGVNGLIESSRVLTSLGIDVTKLIAQALKDTNSQLSDAAYEITDLDALLQEAQAIGDDFVETPETEAGAASTPKEVED